MRYMITKRQMDLCRFVRDFWEANGFGPTFQEMAKGLGITAPSAHALVTACIRRGALRRTEYSRPRSIIVSSCLHIPDAKDAAPANGGIRDGIASGVG